MNLLKRCLMGLGLATMVALPAAAFAQDADGDGAPDAADAFPCDPSLAAISFFPGENSSALLTFEDQWPGITDLDFNDVAVRAHYAFQRDASGNVVGLHATIDPVAVGGQFSNGLALQLPVWAGQVQSMQRRVGGGEWQELAREGDANLTVVLSPNLRELYGNVEGPINSVPGGLWMPGQRLELEVRFTAPVSMSMAEAPFDMFIFREGNLGHQIHFPQYTGTDAMNTALFNTEQDGSAPGRRFVHISGVPAALNLMTSSLYPQEATRVDQLFPNILRFAASGGAEASDFYESVVDAGFGHYSSHAESPAAPGGDDACLNQIGGSDLDGDGLDDAEELALGTDATSGDTDGDGMRDGVEVAMKLDPLQPSVRPEPAGGMPISECGYYAGNTVYLTQDIQAADVGACITSAWSQFSLDCRGHRITGLGQGIGVSLQWAFNSPTSIRNCDISGFDVGIAVGPHTYDAQLTNLAVHGNSGAGIQSGHHNYRLRVLDSRVTFNGGDGIRLDDWAEGSIVGNSVARWNGGGSDVYILTFGSPGLVCGTVVSGEGRVQANWGSMTASEAAAGCPDFGAMDSDGDGLIDRDESLYGTSPMQFDSDGDGLSDGDEVLQHGTSPTSSDTDGDSMPDGGEIFGWWGIPTNPLSSDTDGDGASDADEVWRFGTNPNVFDADFDFDGDGLTNSVELAAGTSIWSWDTDGDRLGDAQELLQFGTNPLNGDTDGDGLGDHDEAYVYGTDPLTWNDPETLDFDGDGLTNGVEASLGTRIDLADTDGDGLSDGLEVNLYSTNPMNSDSDGDGASDGLEVLSFGTDPNQANVSFDVHRPASAECDPSVVLDGESLVVPAGARCTMTGVHRFSGSVRIDGTVTVEGSLELRAAVIAVGASGVIDGAAGGRPGGAVAASGGGRSGLGVGGACGSGPGSCVGAGGTGGSHGGVGGQQANHNWAEPCDRCDSPTRAHCSGAAGALYGSVSGADWGIGSGGGSAGNSCGCSNSGGSGGAGGAAVLLIGEQVTIDGVVNAGGEAPSQDASNCGYFPGGGGGSGGTVLVRAAFLSGSGSLMAPGGAGGFARGNSDDWGWGGGGGGGGRVKVFAASDAFAGSLDASGGIGGGACTRSYCYAGQEGAAGSVHRSAEIPAEYSSVF